MSVTWEPINAPTGEPDPSAATATSAAPPRSRFARIFLGSDQDPRWARPALIGLLGATALLYIVNLSESGYANSFYAAAVEAGTKSWKAMFFGSFDSSNFITVDKPPASLWVMEIFARIFGFSSWSLLIPQALEGVATVGILYAGVKRRFGASAGLIAGALLAVTPVAALMFRFDNPDALLVLLMTVAAYAVIRALETPATRSATRWLIGAGVAIGFAFLTKTLQAFLVVPALGGVYLLFADTRLRRRIFQLAAAGLALILSAGWWLAIVSLWPASSRPYIGGSQDNSEWNLIFGYNGFGRLTGNETGSVGGHASTTGGGMWGSTGITRLLGADMGSQISWLLPTALLAVVALVWLYRRSRRVDTARAQVLLWAGWLVITALTFSFAKGIIHPYYTVALAPPIAALVAIGAVELWRLRGLVHARLAMAALLLVTTGWSYELLDRAATWHPWIRAIVLIFGIAASLAIAVLPTLRQRIVGLVVAGAALVAIFVGPAAYAVETAGTAHTGSIPSAGPSSTHSDLFSSGGGNSFGGPGGRGGFGGQGPMAGRTFTHQGGGFPGAGGFTGGPPAVGGTGSSTGGFPGAGTRPSGAGFPSRGGFGGGFGGHAGFGGGAAGGLLGSGNVSTQLADLLKENASSYTWVAAAVGANSAAGFQLATDEPVMAIGGFNGTDPAPSLATFEKYVSEGKIHYFISGGGGGFGGAQQGGSSDSTQITNWVTSHFTAKTVDGTTIYDLTSPTS